MTHSEILNYNWDNGLNDIWPIVNDSNTEKATALLIYWRLDGPWISEGSAANREANQMNETIKGRIIQGFYHEGELRYDPVSDYKLSKVKVFKLKKTGLPIELIEPNWKE